MKFRWDNTATIKLESELLNYRRRAAKPFTLSKSAFKAKLRAVRAGWIRNESEVIIGLLKNHASKDRDIMEFAVKKGWVMAKDGGKYDNYHFTKSGLCIKDEIAKTTCAFSGKRCKAM